MASSIFVVNQNRAKTELSSEDKQSFRPSQRGAVLAELEAQALPAEAAAQLASFARIGQKVASSASGVVPAAPSDGSRYLAHSLSGRSDGLVSAVTKHF